MTHEEMTTLIRAARHAGSLDNSVRELLYEQAQYWIEEQSLGDLSEEESDALLAAYQAGFYDD